MDTPTQFKSMQTPIQLVRTKDTSWMRGETETVANHTALYSYHDLDDWSSLINMSINTHFNF